MKLIVDAGSTKAHWQITNRLNEVQQVYTDGINLLTHSWSHIETQIAEAIARSYSENIDSLAIYAAGGISESFREEFKQMVSERFRIPVESIVVESDLFLAAMSLCGNKPGIACILGTGSNSCLWNGKSIVKNVRPLGYILGDEGSGAVLGKRLIANWFKGLLSDSTSNALQDFVGLQYPDVMARIYKEPGANKYLAGMTRFMADYRNNEDVKSILHSSFSEFIERNLLQYDDVSSLPVNFVGSIAYYFKDELRFAVEQHGLHFGVVKKDPLE